MLGPSWVNNNIWQLLIIVCYNMHDDVSIIFIIKVVTSNDMQNLKWNTRKTKK